jgi:Flp pilus assembly pilin Flp
MARMRKIVRSLANARRSMWRDRRAVTALEYALIAAIIVGTVVIGFTSLGNALSNQFTNIGSSL